MTGWSIDELREELKALLPKSWQFVIQAERSGFWVVRFEELRESGPEMVWEALEVDERRALFEAYGYLWMKQRPFRELDATWVRRRPMMSPPQSSVSDSSPDPEDIDPEEVESVYSSLGEKS
jgi:hypothetical protein